MWATLWSHQWRQLMNKERVSQLVQQVGTDVSGKWVNIDRMDKFAELIVRECADFAYKEADHLEDELERGRAGDLRRWANVMKKHFGVEE